MLYLSLFPSVLEIGFDKNSYLVNEDEGNVTLTITATIPNPAPGPISFRIRTIAGTAQRKCLLKA